MIKKLFFTFLALFLALQGVFAETFILFKPFVQLLGENGIFGLLTNKFVVFSLIFLAYFFGFFNVLKFALKPVFGSGHPKETNTVAMMISFIGVTGMFYMFSKEDGIEGAILLFGGSVGFFLLALIGLSIIYWAKGKEEKMSKWSWIRVLSASAFVTLVLGMYVAKMLEDFASDFWQTIYEFLYGLSGYLMLAALVMFLLNFRKNKMNDMAENKEFDPKVVSAKNNIDSIQKSLSNVNSSLKKIKSEVEAK